MKIFNLIITILALVFIVANALKLDFNNLFIGESIIALIGIVAALIVIVLVQILIQSKRIEEKTK